MIQFNQVKKVQKQKNNSEKNLKELREYLKKQSETSCKQKKQNQQLNTNNFKQTQILLKDNQQFNINQKEKKKGKKKEKKIQNSTISVSQNLQSQNVEIQKQQNKKINEKQIEQCQSKIALEQRKVQNQRQEILPNSQEQNKNKNRKQQFQVVHYDHQRKWNEELVNPKKGKYTPEETKLLIKGLNQYLLQNNIELDWLIEHVDTQHSQKIPNDLKLWTTVCSILPNRSLKSTYKFLRRKLNINNKGGKWTTKQENTLFKLHSIYGNQWKVIAKQLGRTPENVRDKFRNFHKKNSETQKPYKQLWTIEQLVIFFKQIERITHVEFIKKGIDALLQNAKYHNEKQVEDKKNNAYNSKYIIFHNNIKILQVIDADKFVKIDRQQIKWKQISDNIQNKCQLDCKNKYFQFMDILNRDETGQTQSKVINFLQKQINIIGNDLNQETINWKKWDQANDELTVEQAKCTWRTLKKKIKNIAQQSLTDTIQLVKAVNERKKLRNKIKQLKIKQKLQFMKLIKQKRITQLQQKSQSVHPTTTKSAKPIEPCRNGVIYELLQKRTQKEPYQFRQQNDNNIQNNNNQVDNHNEQNFQQIEINEKNKKKVKSKNNDQNDHYKQRYKIEDRKNRKKGGKKTNRKKKKVTKNQ